MTEYTLSIKKQSRKSHVNSFYRLHSHLSMFSVSGPKDTKLCQSKKNLAGDFGWQLAPQSDVRGQAPVPQPLPSAGCRWSGGWGPSSPIRSQSQQGGPLHLYRHAVVLTCSSCPCNESGSASSLSRRWWEWVLWTSEGGEILDVKICINTLKGPWWKHVFSLCSEVGCYPGNFLFCFLFLTVF